jgi:hypothetical protein
MAAIFVSGEWLFWWLFLKTCTGPASNRRPSYLKSLRETLR